MTILKNMYDAGQEKWLCKVCQSNHYHIDILFSVSFFSCFGSCSVWAEYLYIYVELNQDRLIIFHLFVNVEVAKKKKKNAVKVLKRLIQNLGTGANNKNKNMKKMLKNKPKKLPFLCNNTSSKTIFL